MSMFQPKRAKHSARRAVLFGLAAGVIFAMPAIFLAIGSAGAGHGDYIAARILFPFSMLLTLVEGMIGPIAIGVGLLQFPLYGALIGRALTAKSALLLLLLAAAHVLAVIGCFAGLLDSFS